MGNPLLTATITCYNYAAYLPRAIESILNQSFQDFELVIVDNASTDNSVAIAQGYAAKDPRVRVFTHEKNMGHAYSLAESCERARGKYRVHVDADDWVEDRQAFERQLAIMEQNPEVVLVFSTLVGYNRHGEVATVLRAFTGDAIVSGAEAADVIMAGGGIAHTGAMIRLSAYNAFGGYDRRFFHPLDLKLWVDLCAQGKVAYINKVLYGCQLHDISLSRTAKLADVRDETLKVIDTVFAGPLGAQFADPKAVRRRAISNTLMGELTNFIFSGRYKAGWSAYWDNLRLMPRETLLQKRTLILAARTLLGAGGFRKLEQLQALISGRKRQRIADETQLQSGLAVNK